MYAIRSYYVPISYSHREQLVKPKYLPSTDIVVEEAALLAANVHQDSGSVVRERPEQIIRRSQTLRVSDSYSVQNLRLGLPSDAWYVAETINKLSFGFNYSTARQRVEARRHHSLAAHEPEPERLGRASGREVLV